MMFAEIALFPQQASTTAEQVDTLFLFLLRRLRGGNPPGGVPAGLFLGALPAAAGRGGQSGRNALLPRPGMVLDPHAAGHFHGHVRVGRRSLFRRLSPARRRRHDLRRRQAMDVEVSTSGRAARNQHAARARGAAGPPADDFRRRDPQPLHSRLPHPHGPAAGAIHVGLVPGDPAGNVPPVLFPVLRHQPRGNDGTGRRHGTGGLRPLAAPGGRGIDGPGRAKGVSQVPLRQLPQRRRGSPGAGAGEPLSPAGRPERRPRGRGRRELHPRIDRHPQRQDRGGLREHHADFPRPGERRRDLRVDRLHPVVEAGRDAQAGGELIRRPRRRLPSTARISPS